MASRTPAINRVEAAIDELRRRGERVTPARRAVLEVIDESDGHWSAEEIVAAASKRMPSLHRATVYRALATMGELDIVTHTHVGGSGSVYHLAVQANSSRPEAGHHGHLQCIRCRQVIDVPIESMQSMADILDRDYGFELHGDHVALTGICSNCR